MRVTANVFAECGECFYCRRGQGNLCENLVYNFGAFAEYMIIPASIVSKTTFEIPAPVSYAEAALVEPLATVVHGWHKVGIRPGDTVAILGAGGPVSLLYLQLALRSGASQVVAIGHSPARLEVAARLGASHILNAKVTDTVTAVRELTGGYGVDVVIECAGTKAAWETALDAVRRGGQVLWFGGLPSGTKVEIDAGRVHYGEIDILNMHGGTSADACEAFDLIATSVIEVAPLLSGELPLEQVEPALKRMMAGEVVKLVINPVL
jgi:L-iditol 2-dehydrogenase